jgi:hypothetical protein
VNKTYYSDYTRFTSGLSERLDEGQIKGENAHTYMEKLDFDTVWETRANYYPVLQKFADIPTPQN